MLSKCDSCIGVQVTNVKDTAAMSFVRQIVGLAVSRPGVGEVKL